MAGSQKQQQQPFRSTSAAFDPFAPTRTTQCSCICTPQQPPPQPQTINGQQHYQQQPHDAPAPFSFVSPPPPTREDNPSSIIFYTHMGVPMLCQYCRPPSIWVQHQCHPLLLFRQ
uniref:Uncharacterized protein n=1 Tax=Ditylum brightwellii TaxID=49249 RepID=A0A7S1YT51_9STRA|mmetsp:Transcript_16842/g.24951  ORF Transcript_16842/g.24951 Transcript_16842/m.24951 type:complete len:115 (+) Transcript_16842:1480-1824(+)